MDRLRYLDDTMPPNVEILFSDKHTIRQKLTTTDLLIGAVLIPGARAPRLIERADLRLMKPGSVVVDVAIDQGGCIETSRPTTHRDPVYVLDDVLHYCVANIPGAVGRTSTFALCNVTLPWALRIAGCGLRDAAKQWRPIASAINAYRGTLTNPQVAEAFGLSCSTFAA
jgi:alanine dehydrogenase